MKNKIFTVCIQRKDRIWTATKDKYGLNIKQEIISENEIYPYENINIQNIDFDFIEQTYLMLKMIKDNGIKLCDPD